MTQTRQIFFIFKESTGINGHVLESNIRYKSGNSSTVGIDKVMMPPIELLKCWHQFSHLVSLRQQS